jgi:DNA-binding winged helix-turn-helix (wHTH) protein
VHRYRFNEFILSPRRRVLLRAGREQPLIPRYFDLLVFLVERRGEAVHRRDIFDRVWNDVVVSDSALSQAIRTIRRVLDDDSREPRYVRTVSRHGYQFVFADVVEEEDGGDWPAAEAATVPVVTAGPEIVETDPFDPLLDRIARPVAGNGDEEEQREAAERLHALGTAEALRRLAARGEQAYARALLRETRWDAAEAGPVPILGEPGAFDVARHLVRLRLRRAATVAASRWRGAALGGGIAGGVAGAVGGLLLAMAPGSAAPLAVVPVLSLIGAAAGGAGGAGVGAGLAGAESVLRSRRLLALVAGGAAGGGLAGLIVQLLAHWSLQVLVGNTSSVGGGLEGIAIGAAAGLGYALGTEGGTVGVPAPRGAGRVRAAALTAATCALAALALSLSGYALVGGTIHAIAQASAGGSAVLTPLGRLIGEPGFGPITAALIAAGEGAAFGFGLAFGLTRRV